MNRKQIICMWCGIVTVVFCAFVTIVHAYHPDYIYFGVCVFLIALVTGGMIYTFKDRQGVEGETKKSKNLKRGLRRIILVLAILGFLCVSLITLWHIIDTHDFVRRHERQLEYYKNAVETGKYNISQSDVVEQAARLEKAKNNFWAKLSIGQVVTLCVLAGIGGFCCVWLVYLFVRICYKLIIWLTLGFRVDTG